MIAEITSLEVFLNILQFVVPSLVVFGVTYTMLQKLLDYNYRNREIELRKQKSELITPVKLQAYERLTLFLERISPDNLVLRMATKNMSATQLKIEMQNAIAEEFSHNVSQQIYISNQSWTLIKAVKEQVIQMIDNCYKDVAESSSAAELGKAILKEMMVKKENPTRTAIDFIKKEIDLVF